MEVLPESHLSWRLFANFSPAIIMCSETVRNMLVNFSRELIFTAGPSFPFLASMRAAYNVLKDGLAEEVSDVTAIWTIYHSS